MIKKYIGSMFKLSIVQCITFFTNLYDRLYHGAVKLRLYVESDIF